MFNRRIIPRVVTDSKHGAPYLTINARKWFESEDPLFHGTGRSGLTPQNPDAEYDHLTLDERKRALAIERYQRQNLVGFSADELYDLEAIEKPNAKQNTLTNEVHPIFQRANWKTGPAFTYYGEKIWRSDGQGFWDIADDAVWEYLLPSLRIASRLISNCHIFPWFDALFNGPRKDVRPPRCPKNFKNKLQTFETRPPWVIRNENDFNANRNWGAVLEAISFNLHSCMEISMYNEDGNMMPNMNENMLGWTGHTVSNKDDSGDVVVHLAIEAVEPLLDPNITQSERLLTTFLLAKTLVHELCHASIRAMNKSEGLDTEYEPYFESEDVSELGYSFENAVFGGKLNTLPGNRKELLNNSVWVNMPIAMTTMTFPNFRDILGKWGNDDPQNANIKTGPRENAGFYFGGPDLNPGRWDGQVFEDTFSISISWIEDMQQDEFWDALVQQYGSEMLKVFPRIIGVRDHYPGDGRKIQLESFGEDYIKYLRTLERNRNDKDTELEPPGKVAQDLWNRRILRARAIAAKRELRRKRSARSRQQAQGLPLRPLPTPSLTTPIPVVRQTEERDSERSETTAGDQVEESAPVSDSDNEFIVIEEDDIRLESGDEFLRLQNIADARRRKSNTNHYSNTSIVKKLTKLWYG